MRDYTSLKINDIKNILTNEYGYKIEDFENIKGKKEFTELLKSEDGIGVNIDLETVDFNTVETFEETGNDIEEQVPLRTDIGWNDYVIKQFTEEELFNGNPTTDGLKRVAEKLLGEIVSINSDVLQYPQPENEKRATVKVTIQFADGKIFTGVSDSYYGNTSPQFKNYPVAISETRSIGRCLRSALGLRKVVAAEELSTSNEDGDYTGEKALITDNQIKFIEIMCAPNRLNVNIERFVKQQGFTCDKITRLAHEDSLELQKKLSEYQQDITQIPDEIKIFDSNWRINFT